MKLKRQFENKYGTFGILTTQDGKQFHTLECNYESNKPYISCVPPGEYKLEAHNSTRYGDTVALVNHDLAVTHYSGELVDNHRFGILFHSANIVDELQGCIAPGLGVGVVHGDWAITDSRAAMEKLRGYFETDETLVIE